MVYIPAIKLTMLLVFTLSVLPVSGKICFAAWNVKQLNKSYERTSLWDRRHILFLTVLLFFGAYVPPLFQITVPYGIICATAVILSISAVPAWKFLAGNTTYRKILKRELNNANLLTTNSGSMNQTLAEGYREKLVHDVGEVNTGDCCKDLNVLFFRRHKNLFYKPTVRITVIVAVLTLIMIVLALVDSTRENLNTYLMNRFTVIVFLMYLINRGKDATQIFFFNCDHSLLRYKFYRKPKILLKLFAQRLKTIFLLNLAPTSIVAVGVPLMLFLSGGTDQRINYLMLPLSILSIALFFSVHYLVLYYLLQPYTEGLEGKSYFYNALVGLTYLFCYQLMHLEISLFTFAIASTVLALIYVILALILIYLFSGKTFKIRQ